LTASHILPSSNIEGVDEESFLKVVACANLYVYQYIFRDCLITAGVNSFTSIFSGFVVFLS
jgi:hypothetical protein